MSILLVLLLPKANDNKSHSAFGVTVVVAAAARSRLAPPAIARFFIVVPTEEVDVVLVRMEEDGLLTENVDMNVVVLRECWVVASQSARFKIVVIISVICC